MTIGGGGPASIYYERWSAGQRPRIFVFALELVERGDDGEYGRATGPALIKGQVTRC